MESLKGIGMPPWRQFIIAADTFARLQDAQPDNYPNTDDDCLLCHQPLSDDASILVKAYWDFIKSQAEQNSKDSQRILEIARLTTSNLI